MKYILPGLETITIAGQDVDKLVRAGSGDAALLYLYVLKTRGKSTASSIAEALGKSAAEVNSAMAILNRLGLVVYSEKDAEKQLEAVPSSVAGVKPAPETIPPENKPHSGTTHHTGGLQHTGTPRLPESPQPAAKLPPLAANPYLAKTPQLVTDVSVTKPPQPVLNQTPANPAPTAPKKPPSDPPAPAVRQPEPEAAGHRAEEKPYQHTERELPKYTISEVRRELERRSEFAQLVEDTQRRLGKMMSPDELIRLYGIYEGLRLPPEVIYQLITHCFVESITAGGRSPTMRYIEKAAFTWEREGIFTLEKAEEYLKMLDRQKSVRGEIMKVLQIKDREFSASERFYVEGWLTMGFTAEVIAIAYDRTILKTGKLTWAYLDSILKSWYNKGLQTAKDINEKDGKSVPQRLELPEKTKKHGAPNPEDIERMKKLLEKMNDE